MPSKYKTSTIREPFIISACSISNVINNFMELKKSALFLLILASLLSASIATGTYRNIINQVPEGQTMTEDTKDAELDEDAVRARILMAKTNDYGWYDPAPAFSRPHFKRIPN
ncbi:uncharacterized protein LOC144554247 isoform X2 [Carex rostrata]